VQYVASADRGAGRAAATTTLHARRAVISAAGPYGSPKLLLLSGIGPPAALRAAGVTPTVSLPAVGARMQTRPYAEAKATYSGVPLELANNASLLADPATLAQWRAGRGGVLGVAAAAALGRQTDGRGAYIAATFTPLRSTPGHREYVSACFSNPSATGRLTLSGADPFAQPVVRTNLLGGAAAEVSTLVACLRRLRAITRPFPRAWGMREVEPPASRRLDAAHARATTLSAQHMVGGCAVGAVLNGRLRVRGVARLHVVDASAIPSMTPSAGPMASVYSRYPILSAHFWPKILMAFLGPDAAQWHHISDPSHRMAPSARAGSLYESPSISQSDDKNANKHDGGVPETSSIRWRAHHGRHPARTRKVPRRHLYTFGP